MRDKFNMRFVLFTMTLFLVCFAPCQTDAAPVLSDYVSAPITASTNEKPNIVVFLDNSESMAAPIQNSPYYTDTVSGTVVATDAIDYGGGYWEEVGLTTTIALADVADIEVYKLVYDANNDPAFYRVCTDIENVCTVDHDNDVVTADEDITPAAGAHALYTTLTTTGSDGVYYYGHYLNYQPPNRFQVALQVMIGEANIGGGSGEDLNHDGSIDLDDATGNDKGRILGQFEDDARWLNATFKKTGPNINLQTTTSFTSSYNANVSNMNNWNVNDGINSELAFALHEIEDDVYTAASTYNPYGSGSNWFPCRQSFIIYISDGTPDGDVDTGAHGDQDTDGREGGGVTPEDYLDDCAKFHYEADGYPDASYPEMTGTQNVTVYTIGFGVATRSDDADGVAYDAFDDEGGDFDKLLRDTATNSSGEYYVATDVKTLVTKIKRAIAAILERAGSGTAVSVLATSGSGEGAVYQAVFIPSVVADDGSDVSWMGFLQTFWVDSLGLMKQDTNGDGTLDGGDLEITYVYTSSAGTLVKVGNATCSDADTTGCVKFQDAKPVWEAGEMLAERSNRRDIYTFIDFNEDGACGGTCYSSSYDYGASDNAITDLSDEFGTFTTGNKTKLRPYLRAVDDDEAEKIITYIRGESDYLTTPDFYRNRTLDVNGTQKIWTLGDLVNSSPLAIGAPTERYDKLYGDSSYAQFYDEWKSRETIIYVGANDGMLHAFSGGKWNSATNSFDTVDEPPGTELWAYIPYDVLPHLKWLTDTSYDHIYYVDMKVKVTDAPIFPCDAAHSTNASTTDTMSTDTGLCWGTILIGGMGLGGGQIDVEGDFNYDGGTVEKTFKSSYFALDVTNPLVPPKLLWRFRPQAQAAGYDIGFTTSRPTVAKVGGSWFAIFGSGPDNSYDYDFTGPSVATGSDTPDYEAEYKSASKDYNTVDTAAKIFVVNLIDGTLAKTFTNTDNSSLADNRAFMASPIAVDIDFDNSETNPTSGTWNDEVVYIGETSRNAGANNNTYPWEGTMFRIVLNSSSLVDSLLPSQWALTVVYDPVLPISGEPAASMDTKGNPWLFFGTGRMYSDTDKENDPDGNQILFGLQEVCWDPVADPKAMNRSGCAIASGDIYDSTSIKIFLDGSSTGDASLTTFSALEAEIRDNKKGWKIDLQGAGERVLTKPGVVAGLLFATTVSIEGTDLCGLIGTGTLYSLFFGTGTAFFKSTIGIDSNSTNADGSKEVLKSMSLGEGSPAGVAVHFGSQSNIEDNDSGTAGTVFIQDSTGKVTRLDITTAYGVKSGLVSWSDDID